MKTIFHIAALVPLYFVAGCASNLATLPSSDFERSPIELRAPDDQIQLDSHPVTDHTQENAAVNQAADALLDVDAVNAPLDALIFALADESGYSLRINGGLNDNVTLKSSRIPLTQLLDQLTRQVPFTWQLEGAALTLWSGEPFVFTYSVDYLNIHRSTHSSVGLATQVGTINAADSGNGSIANSSQTRIENTSEHHFWNALQDDVQDLVSGDANTRFSINAEAGLLSLYAQPAVHETVKQYLELLQASARRQVLIEATVVEVALSDSFEAGVDWQVLAAGVSGMSALQSLTGAPLVNAASINRVTTPAGLVSLVQSDGRGDVSATLSLLEQFGDVRILSRPRIIALNNQSSVLKVVDNRVYFTAKVERSRSDTTDDTVTETEIHTVPVGLVMNVTPQISATGSVMLNVRPTLSRILGFVNDPNPELAQANVRNGVPEIQVREMESMLNVQSGQVAIIGGLMQETSEQNDARLPGLGTLPLIGNLFSQRARKHRQTELLIVLRPTVVTASLQAVEPS